LNLQALIKLIYENDISQLKEMRSSGVNFTVVDSRNNGNLLLAFSTYGYEDHYSQSEMVSFLVDSGIDVNHQSNGRYNGESALHKAIKNGHFELVKALIANGAILDIKDNNRNTPLWNAVMSYRGNKEQLDIINFLIAKGSSLDTQNNQDSSPRHVITTIGLGIDNGHNKKEWDLRFLLE
jgi:ankyrin repeat protein